MKLDVIQIYQNTLIMPRTSTVCCRLYVFFVFSDSILFLTVPNGPADSDSEPTNQMPWKEGRQLLRKSVYFVCIHFQIYLSKILCWPCTCGVFVRLHEQVSGGGGIFWHHLGHAFQTCSFPVGSQQPRGEWASSQRTVGRTRTSRWRRVTASAPDRRANQTVRATRILTS